MNQREWREMRAAEVAFSRVSSGKLFSNSWSIWRKITTIESDLTKFVPTTLLKSLSVMDTFLEDSQEFNKEGSFVLMIVTKEQFLKNSQGEIACHQVNQSKMKKLVNKIYFPLSFAFELLDRMVAHIWRWSQCGWRV